MVVDAKLMRRFVRMAGRELEGDWVVMGGGVLPLVGIGRRVTLDIDVAGPPESRQDQALKLMDIAERLGLPVEAVNQAGAFFLRRIQGWQDGLVVVYEGRSARILRPDVTLFLMLKLGRMSETDLTDCLGMLAWARKREELPDVPRLRRAITRARVAGESEPHAARLDELEAALTA